MPSASDVVVAATAKSYDAIPYDSMAFDYTQPEHIAAVAILMGMQVTSLDNARVLEIGCASGGNLVSFAAKHPAAYCLGVDISSRQIEEGQQFIQASGLSNIELKALDIRELDSTIGKFDYIICHGVLAWVPAEVQHGILAAIKQRLTDNGVAYVSYNVYPGWHSWEIARHLMYRATAHIDDPQEKIKVAMQALEAFAEDSLNTKDRPIAQVLKERKDKIESAAIYYVYHEYLESCNYPFYFKDFVALCADKGLRYLGDTTFGTMFLDSFGEDKKAVQWIKKNARHRYDEEEYMDYLSGRTFRRSLIVHDHISLELAVKPERLNQLCVFTNYKLLEKNDQENAPQFVKYDDKNIRLTFQDDYSLTVLSELAIRIPHPIELPELLMIVWQKMGEDINSKSDQDILAGLAKLSSLLLQLIKKEVVQISFQPVMAKPELSDHPIAWRVARTQAKLNANILSNVYCKLLPSNPVMVACLILCDGNHHVNEIESQVARSQKISASQVKSALEKIARSALLVE